MAKIGLMGGTFNPIHNAHLALAEAAYNYCGLDQVWFMPSGVSYLKSGLSIPDSEVRSDMVRLAIENVPYFSFCDVEIRREGNTYTADTLEELTNRYPEHEFFFLMGADSAFYFPHWYQPERITRLCTLGIVNRNPREQERLEAQIQLLQNKLHAKAVLIPFQDLSDISSSRIRELVRLGEPITDYVPSSVAEYIRRNRLYTGSSEDQSKGRQCPKDRG
ncbi:MAG: nicotinate (nicotinamide) nucleotide adenylyltransferase [Lachnospiraceae bacterium]|nr:nicotinate (nicotinamide) nucleotide adenylyltransferase [Lachnospiraceae bacterium]